VRVDCCAGPAENPHAVRLSTGRYVDTCGKDVIWDTSQGHLVGITATVTWDVLRVDHFILKSREEFEEKRARGRLITSMQDGDWEAYYASHDRNEVEEPMPAELVQRTKSEIDRITHQLRAPGTISTVLNSVAMARTVRSRSSKVRTGRDLDIKLPLGGWPWLSPSAGREARATILFAARLIRRRRV
jgi:hypothetical protein